MRLGDSDFCRTSKDYNVEKHVPENRTQLYHLPHLFRGTQKPAEHYVIYLHEGRLDKAAAVTCAVGVKPHIDLSCCGRPLVTGHPLHSQSENSTRRGCAFLTLYVGTKTSLGVHWQPITVTEYVTVT